MSHLQDLMDRNNENLIKEACEKFDSEMEAKVACGLRGDSLMSMLGPIFSANPPANMDQIRDLLGQVIQQELQQTLTKKEMAPESDPIEIHRKKLSNMADLLRSKVRVADLQKELIETQETLAAKIRTNPMLQATLQGMMGGGMQQPGQMPLPGGAPGAPMAPPPAPPVPPALPTPAPPAPAAGAPISGAAGAPKVAPPPTVPESPMAAVTKTAPKK
jgi:hypothetical protein